MNTFYMIVIHQMIAAVAFSATLRTVMQTHADGTRLVAHSPSTSACVRIGIRAPELHGSIPERNILFMSGRNLCVLGCIVSASSKVSVFATHAEKCFYAFTTRSVHDWVISALLVRIALVILKRGCADGVSWCGSCKCGLPRLFGIIDLTCIVVRLTSHRCCL